MATSTNGQTRKQVERPTSVKVGYATYAIEWLDDDEWYVQRQDDDWGGVTIHEEMRILIRVAERRAEDSMRETLLHEITHAVWAVRALNQYPTPEDMNNLEEYIIHSQTGGLLGALSDNPGVVAYLINVMD